MSGVGRYSLADFYIASLGAGLRSIDRRYWREAIARIVNPLSYPRELEYRLVFDMLAPLDGCRVLDIGSPKLPVLLLAREPSVEVHATDIRDYFIGPTKHFLRRIGLEAALQSRVSLEVQDARALKYPSATFDRVFAISVLEHIPDDGDSRAVTEIARVLRPGGIAAITVPFASTYRDEFVRGDVYERTASGAETFFQRRYDRAALFERLVRPSGLQVVEEIFFGEPLIRFEPYWNRIPMRWKVPLLWAQPFLARLFLHVVPPERLDIANGVALKLSKTE